MTTSNRTASALSILWTAALVEMVCAAGFASPAKAWTRADLVTCVSPLATESCPIPSSIQTMIHECDEAPLSVQMTFIRNGLDIHDVEIACENFVLANGRAWTSLDEVRAQMALEKAAQQASEIAISTKTAQDAIQAVRTILLSGTRDPDSAKFRNEHVISWNGATYVCLEMNAKNGFGGYVGYTPYMVNPAGSAIDLGVAEAIGEARGVTPQCESVRATSSAPVALAPPTKQAGQPVQRSANGDGEFRSFDHWQRHDAP